MSDNENAANEVEQEETSAATKSASFHDNDDYASLGKDVTTGKQYANRLQDADLVLEPG